MRKQAGQPQQQHQLPPFLSSLEATPYLRLGRSRNTLLQQEKTNKVISTVSLAPRSFPNLTVTVLLELSNLISPSP